MDDYVVEIDENMETLAAWIRAWLQRRPDPPWLDLGDRILWFPSEAMRQHVQSGSPESQRACQQWLPCIGWWSGRLMLFACRDEVLDAAQQDLIAAMAREWPIRLLAHGFHPTPITDLTDPELYTAPADGR